MKDNAIEFGFDEMAALGALLASLNRNGVPYSLKKDAFAVRVTIYTGY